MGRWRRVFTFPATDRRLLVEAGARLVLAWCFLRILPFKRIVASLGHRAGKSGAGLQVGICRVGWAVETAARHLPMSLTCLPQALAASWMLRARGFAPCMYYGVATTTSGSFESHAWVELDGMPVVGYRVANRFTLLSTFPATREGSE